MKFIATDTAPTPAGHYSQAVVHGGLIYVSGQLPLDPETRTMAAGASVTEQTQQVLANLTAILRAAGSDLDRVVKVTIYVSDVAHWGEVNAAYAEAFGDHRPARAIVPSRELNHGALLELEAIAAVGDA